MYKNCLFLWPRLKKTLKTAKTEFIVAIKRERSVACNEFLLEETIISRELETNSAPHQKYHRVLRQERGLELSQTFVVTGLRSSGRGSVYVLFESTLSYCSDQK